MSRVRDFFIVLLMAACGSLLTYHPVRAGELDGLPQPAQAQPEPQRQAANGTGAKLFVTVGKSLIIDSPVDIRRVSVANGTLAEAVAVNPKEVLINGLAPGETSLIVWQQSGARMVYDLTVRMSGQKLEAARQQIAHDFPGDDINLTFENDTAFVRGRVKDLIAADRVMSIAMTLGKAVNLLNVDVPGVDPQVVLKVRFANVDRSASLNFGAAFANGSFNQHTAIGPGSVISTDGARSFSIGQAINLFLFRRDINLVAAIEALQSQRQLELLAEPNLLAISGQQASFLAGGEFPFPMVQPGQGASAISVMWREYGIRLGFLPTVTPRGTIRLKVAPEVSSLDYTNAVTVQGVTIPGLSSRRVETAVELESGQSFVIAGLLDNQAREGLAKVPGISKIPVLGKLFESKTVNRSNSELLVIITPEVVRPIPAGEPVPDLKYPISFLNEGQPPARVSHPGLDKTGPVPVHPPTETIPIEQLLPKKEGAAQGLPTFQLVPPPPAEPPASAGVKAPPAAAKPAGN
jgi:pilus assembly protein CpaC